MDSLNTPNVKVNKVLLVLQLCCLDDDNMVGGKNGFTPEQFQISDSYPIHPPQGAKGNT